jgi:pantoate--beta-alanine ligase
MEFCDSVAAVRRAVTRFREGRERVALVPTMGALHAGHMALVAEGRARADRVVASIFVNPTQFGDPADLQAYPRTLDADRRMLEAAGVDALFAPAADEMYGPGDETVVEPVRLAQAFHGVVRPGHFRGVATVVVKLLNVVQPDVALFGEKDYQQLAVIRRVVRDLLVPVEVVGVPTVREADGLAMSSRNARLRPEDRAAATVLSRALARGHELALSGLTAEAVGAAVLDRISAEPRAREPRVDVVDGATFEPLRGPLRGRAGIMVSARFGDVLLIDQREVEPLSETIP